MLQCYKLLFFTVFVAYCAVVSTVYAQPVNSGDTSINSDKDFSITETSAGNKSQKIESILFSETDLSSIMKARLFYEKNSEGNLKSGIVEEDFLRTLEKVGSMYSEQEPTPDLYPQFYLSSLAYHSQDNWTIWINGKKITQDYENKPFGLQIHSIDNEKVVFEWHPKHMDKISKIEIGAENNTVSIDYLRNKVLFTLRVNQTFSSETMRIIEGKAIINDADNITDKLN